MSQPALKPDATSSRIASRFAALRQRGQKAFITFIAAGDPDLATSEQILAGLPKAGADIIELSIPFSDPMADGPTIQAANIRAFKAGITLLKVLEMVGRFRKADSTTPLVLMGYYNPIYIYGVDKFLKDAKASGVDGLIVVDLPPEEDTELCDPAKAVGLDFIRLVTPTTDTKRLPAVLKNASGFLYYVSMAGVTGTKAIDANAVTEAVSTLKNASALPVAVGFGITTPDEARAISAVADGVIVGSAIVKTIASNLDQYGAATPNLVGDVLSFVSDLAKAIHNG